MKTFIFVLLTFIPITKAGETVFRPFRFVEAQSIKELSKLPPKLVLTFEIMCNEELFKVVRHDWIEPRTKRVSIAVGGIVRENINSSCAGQKVTITAEAGTTFSGREYEITRIKP